MYSIALFLNADPRGTLRILFLFFKLFYLFCLKIFYLFIHERHREREAETQTEVEAGSLQGHGTRSQDPEITT